MSEDLDKILWKLHEYYDARDTYKSLRTELIKLAVDFGQPQKDALEGGAPAYLDGYLVGAGMLPDARKIENKP